MSTPPVEPDETLYRQLTPGGKPLYFDPTRNPPVLAAVFIPGTADIDGLSMIRARYRSPVWAAFRPNRPETRFSLATCAVSALRDIALRCGFTSWPCIPDPDELDGRFGEPWAHCVLGCVNRSDYESDHNTKKQIKQWAKWVAESLGPQNIARPFSPPTDDDPYRP